MEEKYELNDEMRAEIRKNVQNQEKIKSFSYKVGHFCALIVVGCLTACVVALAARFIMWIL